MEENNNKNNMSELVKLMHKTEKAMEMTREKQRNINAMNYDLMQETRPMMVEQGKTELANKKQDKEEFDEMTVEALRRAKTEVLKIREESEKEYQEKLLETLEKRKQIEKKLKSMEQKGLPEEKLAMAKSSAEKALTKANEEMKTYQDKHFIKRAKLDEFEAKINDFGVELGVEIEPLKESEQQIEDKPEDNKQPEENKEKNENSTVVEEKTTEEPDEIVKPNGGPVIDGNLSTETELPKVASVEVKDNKYIITYENKENGVYSYDKKECEKLGFFKGLFEKAKLIANRKEYGIDFISAMRADVNILRNLSDKDKEKYLSYIAGQTAGCFDIKYDNPKNRYAKALAKGQTRLALKHAEKLEEYRPNTAGYIVDVEGSILPRVDKENHDKQQSKYDKMFGKGFDQHKNPPVAPKGKPNKNTQKGHKNEKKVIEEK